MLYGTYPLLAIAGGRMIPTMSADQYAATLARWFGIEGADVDLVALHLANFDVRDLGFLVYTGAQTIERRAVP